jgi:hydrophobe/amphiphile efflux-3 (HAE3) family protein
MIQRAVRFLIRQRVVTCVLLGASLVLAAFGAARIEFRFQYADFYDHPQNREMPILRRYVNEFEDGGALLLLIEAPDVFADDALGYLTQLSSQLSRNPLIARVRSLSNVNLVRATPDGIESGPLFARTPRDLAERASLRLTALESRLLVRRLVSNDSRLTAVSLRLRTHATSATIAEQERAIAAVEQVLRDTPKPAAISTRISGGPTVEVETTGSLIRDQAVLTPVVLLLLALALYATFRSVQGVLLPLAAVSTSLIWTLGVFGITFRTADLTASVIPTTLLVYGVVDPVFVLARYYQRIEAGRTRDDAIVEAVAQLLLPCFLTSLSTALGFAAFATATLPTIRHFGLIVAFGVALSFVTTVVVLPVLLTIVPTPQRRLSSHASAQRVDGFLRALFRHTQRRRVLVIATALGIVGLGALAFARTRINNEYVGLLPDGPTLRSVEVVDRKLSGVMTHAVYLEGPPGSMQRPEVLQSIAAIDAFAEHDPMVGSVTSLADVVSDAHRAFNDNTPEHDLPTSPNLIAQYLSLLEPSDRVDFVSDDYARSHVLIRSVDPGSQTALRFLRGLERQVQAQHLERFGIRASLTGAGVAYRQLDLLVHEVLLGFALAFAIIVALQWLLFRSARIALASILPNLVPVALAFWTMRIWNLDLRMDNSLVLCVCVGGLFNTTIHLVARMLQQLRDGARDPNQIIEQALRTVGPASLYAALVLSLGFSVLMLSQFPGLRAFGLLSAVTLISGFFADAMITVVLMRWLVDAPLQRVAATGVTVVTTQPVPSLQRTEGHT